MKWIYHHLYSMYHDVTRLKFVRKQLYVYLAGIVLTWMMAFSMGIHVIHPIIGTVILVAVWIFVYYKFIYPYVSKLVNEVIVESKYPHFNNRFENKN